MHEYVARNYCRYNIFISGYFYSLLTVYDKNCSALLSKHDVHLDIESAAEVAMGVLASILVRSDQLYMILRCAYCSYTW